MPFLRTLGRVAAGAVNLLVGTNIGGGRSGGGGQSPVETVAGVIDKYKYTEQERATDIMSDLQESREFAAPGQPLGLIGQLTDGANHAMRPWITFEIVSRWLGYRSFPPMDDIAPFWQTVIWLVLTFWFGGRMIVKDIPAMLEALRKLRK